MIYFSFTIIKAVVRWQNLAGTNIKLAATWSSTCAASLPPKYSWTTHKPLSHFVFSIFLWTETEGPGQCPAKPNQKCIFLNPKFAYFTVDTPNTHLRFHPITDGPTKKYVPISRRYEGSIWLLHKFWSKHNYIFIFIFIVVYKKKK